MKITRALVYWQGRWLTEEMRLASLLMPWATLLRNLDGTWCLVSISRRATEYAADNVAVTWHGNTLQAEGV